MKHQRNRLFTRALQSAIYLGALALVTKSEAAVSLLGTFTFNAGTGVYSYSYSVTNTGTDQDLALITFPVPTASNLLGITSPVGFDLTFDPSAGEVSIFEDSSIITPQTFAPLSTVSPFTFTSTYGPGLVTFDAFDAAGTEFVGTTSGPVTAPVPEPSLSVLACLALAIPAFARRRDLPSAV